MKGKKQLKTQAYDRDIWEHSHTASIKEYLLIKQLLTHENL